MTLIAALAGEHCGLMFADSQETVSGYAKKSVSKITAWKMLPDHGFRFAIGGAAEDGPYLDMFTNELTTALLTLTLEKPSLEQICGMIEHAALAFHQKHIWPQGNSAPTLETLILMQSVYRSGEQEHGSHCDIIHIHKTAVNLLLDNSRKSIGIGSYLADYLLEKLMAGGGSEAQLLATAVYVLKQVKLHVDGVGLNGDIVLFPSTGEIEEYEQEDINAVEDVLSEFDEVMTFCFKDLGIQVLTECSQQYCRDGLSLLHPGLELRHLTLLW